MSSMDRAMMAWLFTVFLYKKEGTSNESRDLKEPKGDGSLTVSNSSMKCPVKGCCVFKKPMWIQSKSGKYLKETSVGGYKQTNHTRLRKLLRLKIIGKWKTMMREVSSIFVCLLPPLRASAYKHCFFSLPAKKSTIHCWQNLRAFLPQSSSFRGVQRKFIGGRITLRRETWGIPTVLDPCCMWQHRGLVWVLVARDVFLGPIGIWVIWGLLLLGEILLCCP